MEIQEVKDLALQLRFECSDEEAQAIKEDFDLLEKQLQFLHQIDTEGVEEMVYPFDVETSFLREDEANHVLSEENALKNAPKEIQGHFIVPKVVNNENS